MVEHPWSACPVWCWLITASRHLSGFNPEEVREACNASALLFRSSVGRGWVGRRRRVETSGQLRGQTWDSECSLMQRRRYLRSDGCGIREPDIFSCLEISQRDEISKWSTCLKMHGIPQGWARATGYKSSTPCTWCEDREGVWHLRFRATYTQAIHV